MFRTTVPLFPPPLAWQVICCGCHLIITLVPPPGIKAFFCPCCRLEQFLPPELLSDLRPSSLHLNSAPPAWANGFNPTTMQTQQTACFNCMAMLEVPRGLTGFKCPLCQIDLALNTSLAYTTLSINEVFRNITNSRLESATAWPPLVVQEQSAKSLKCNRQIKEEVEDCAILDLDPYLSSNVSCHSEFLPDQVRADPDIAIVAEKGLVACRDFPHPRHLCAKFPFQKTPHHIHCHTCYCCLCDAPAPCKEWTKGSTYISHCDATAADIKTWRNLIK